MTEEPGPGVDAFGRQVVDPTLNVLQLVRAAVERLDDLRHLAAEHAKEIDMMRETHARDLRDAEAKRIDAIRMVDVNAVQQAWSVAATQATTLAGQVAAAADAMRTQVTAAATAAAANQAAALAPMQVAIEDLRRAQYEAQGQKTQVVEHQAKGANAGLWIGVAIGALGLLVAAVSIAIALRG